MEVEAQTEAGKRLCTVLANWLEKAPELVVDELKRSFLVNSLKMKNEDAFLTILYGQNLLDESPSALSQKFWSPLLAVQHGMETALNKSRAKELVMALELSENQSLLTHVLSWTEKNTKEIQEIIKRASAVDLAPEKVKKIKSLSETMSGPVTTRNREISWRGEEHKYCSAVEACGNKIIVGFSNGQIRIYTSADLRCQTVLNYCGIKARVTCLQCTCTEIIASYADGNIFVWSIQTRTRLQLLSIADTSGGENFPTSIRWRDPNLVVGTLQGKIHIWQNHNSSFILLGSWDVDKNDQRPVSRVDFNENYVVIKPDFKSNQVRIHYFNGDRCRIISSHCGILEIVVHENHLIMCNESGKLEIRDISTGHCLKVLKTDGIYTFGFDAHDGVIAGADRGGKVIIWNIKAALEGMQDDLARLPHHYLEWVPVHTAPVDKIKIGPHFLVATSDLIMHRAVVFVTDFLTP